MPAYARVCCRPRPRCSSRVRNLGVSAFQTHQSVLTHPHECQGVWRAGAGRGRGRSSRAARAGPPAGPPPRARPRRPARAGRRVWLMHGLDTLSERHLACSGRGQNLSGKVDKIAIYLLLCSRLDAISCPESSSLDVTRAYRARAVHNGRAGRGAAPCRRSRELRLPYRSNACAYGHPIQMTRHGDRATGFT